MEVSPFVADAAFASAPNLFLRKILTHSALELCDFHHTKAPFREILHFELVIGTFSIAGVLPLFDTPSGTCCISRFLPGREQKSAAGCLLQQIRIKAGNIDSFHLIKNGFMLTLASGEWGIFL